MCNTMLKFRRSTALLAALLMALLSTQAFAAPTSVTLYKNLQCTCCEAHAKYLEEQGFKVEVKPVPDLHSINQKAGVPDALEGCHTSFIDGYVVIKTNDVKNLLIKIPSEVLERVGSASAVSRC